MRLSRLFLPLIPAFYIAQTVTPSAGSGANTNRLGDDGEMPQFVPVEELFKGRHFDQEIVVLNVRWYLSYKLSYRDLVAMMAERGIDLAHTTILRWVQHYTPEFQKRWNRFARPVGGSWRMDETYVRVKRQGPICIGRWIKRAKRWTSTSAESETSMPRRHSYARR